MHAQSLQSCPSLLDPMDYSLRGSSVLGILQIYIYIYIYIKCRVCVLFGGGVGDKVTYMNENCCLSNMC